MTMRIWIIWIIAVIFLFLMPLSFAKTKTVILERGGSFVIEEINVTLIDYNKKRDKALVCVDNQRAILSDEKRVGEVYLEIISFRDDGVKIQLDADCDDCLVSDNSECFTIKNFTEENDEYEFEVNETVPADLTGENVTEEESDEKNVETKGGYKGVFKRLLFAIIDLFRVG